MEFSELSVIRNVCCKILHLTFKALHDMKPSNIRNFITVKEQTQYSLRYSIGLAQVSSTRGNNA